MKLFSTILATIGLFIGFTGCLQAQTVVTGNNITISTAGSYILGSPSNSITISASNVTLDMAGRTVASSGQCNLNNSGNSPGCTCTYIPNCNVGSSTALINVTGNNVTVKNGIVSGSFADGIRFNSPTGLGLVNATVENVTVFNSIGSGVYVNGNGATLDKVKSYQNGHDGVTASDGVTLKEVSTNYNNGYGINASAGLGNFTDIIANKNASWGVLANGNLTRVTANGNGGIGIYTLGVVRDATATFNGGDGIDNPNQRGLVIDSSASYNGGNGFTLSNSVCYSRLSSTANTGTQISGGVALSGSVASCQ